MTFTETINKIKEIALIIESYGEPAKETIQSLKWIFSALKLEKINMAIDFICNTEPILLGFLLDSIKRVEEFSTVAGIKGQEKLKQALTFTNQQFRDVNYENLFSKAVGVVNIFCK